MWQIEELFEPSQTSSEGGPPLLSQLRLLPAHYTFVVNKKCALRNTANQISNFISLYVDTAHCHGNNEEDRSVSVVAGWC